MKYYEGIDYWVRFVEFPNMASESVVASHGDGTFTIYINTLFCEERQKDRLQHELRHLEENHFYRDELTITQIERQADDIPEPKEKREPERLPNIFEEKPPGTIPFFASLESFGRYMFAMREQYRRENSRR